MSTEDIQVQVSSRHTATALLDLPEGPAPTWTFIYAPGAGSNLNDPFGTHLSLRLTVQGHATVRFQFPYMEEKRRRPDGRQLLEETWCAVIDQVGDSTPKLAIGGRSMGGRIASQVAPQVAGVDALALFAYPLRPPYDPSKLRDGHLASLVVPTLFCSGTRDSFGTPEELREAVAKVPNARLHLLEGADHGFSVAKSSGRTRQAVWEEAVDQLLDWVQTL